MSTFRCWCVILCAVHATSAAGFFSKRKLQVANLTMASCDDENLVNLTDMQVTTTSSGDLAVSGKMSSGIKLLSPIKASLAMQRRLLGLWVPMPCIGEFGSCVFEDLCKHGVPGSPQDQCPPLFKDNNMPCRCPIDKGEYALPSGKFEVGETRWADLIAGNYKVTVNINSGSIKLACYNADFEMV